MSRLTWPQLLATAGRNKKGGLHWQAYDDAALRGVARPTQLGKDLRVVSVRASDKFRIFGAHGGEDAFLVLWFDPDHRIVPT
jgi:hypothetical protein